MISTGSQTISREELARLPVRRYEGPIHVVKEPELLEQALRDLRRESVVGFDTETKPSFHPGQSHLPSLVQIATRQAVYLFPLRPHLPARPLREVLENPSLVKAGVALGDDLRKLKLLVPFQEQNIVDLGLVAQRHGVVQSGVRNLAGLFLGFRVTKGARTSNWARPQLSPGQILYAATDAWVCRELYLCFLKRGWIKPLVPHTSSP